MRLFVLTLFLFGCTADTTADELAPWSELYASEPMAVADGGALLLTYGGSIDYIDDAGTTTLASGWELDIIGAREAAMLSWTYDDTAGVLWCSDLVTFDGDGWWVDVCGEGFEVES